MIVQIKQYLMSCDVPGCGKRSAIHHNPEILMSMCIETGWKRMQSPSLGLIQLCCPGCVRARRIPEAWVLVKKGKETASGDQIGTS